MTPPVTALLKRWLPGHDLQIERARSGGSTEVYRVHSGDDLFWLRLAEESGEDRSVEYHVHTRLRDLGVRVPEVLIFEVAPFELDRSASLTTHIRGIPLTDCRDGEVARNVAAVAGKDLARINSIRTEGFGWIDRLQPNPPEILSEHPDRPGWTIEYARATDTVLATGSVPSELVTTLQLVMSTFCQSDVTDLGHLVHGDVDATHIYVDPANGEYTGIIDFGEARGADCSYDLGHVLLHDGEVGRTPLFDSIVSGWTEGIPDTNLIHEIRSQAVAIGTRQISIMLYRGQSSFLDFLTNRIVTILRTIDEED